MRGLYAPLRLASQEKPWELYLNQDRNGLHTAQILYCGSKASRSQISPHYRTRLRRPGSTDGRHRLQRSRLLQTVNDDEGTGHFRGASGQTHQGAECPPSGIDPEAWPELRRIATVRFRRMS